MNSTLMPDWLQQHIQKGFQQKDRKKISLLNDCWYSQLEKKRKRTS